MFTGKKQKTLKSAESYFADHLVYGDYYTGGLIDQTGYWIGEGCRKLGLPTTQNEGIVAADEFSRLCRGLHPRLENGVEQKLTLRLNSKGNRVIFDDFTCSAPKSISIMACLAEDNRLIVAHQEAADMAFKELERFATTRVRKNQADYTRTTGNLVAAKFTHSVSRAKDPQLHTHYICMNATFDAVEGRWKALHATQMYEANRFATEVYRNHLRRSVEKLGYRTRNAEYGFEIDGVEDSILQRFSQRAKAIKREVQKHEKRLGRSLDNSEIAEIVHQVRPKKQHVTPEQLADFQKGRLEPEELGCLRGLRKDAEAAEGGKPSDDPKMEVVAGVPRRLPPATPPGVYEKLAIDYAAREAFVRQSVVEESSILQTALAQHSGKIDLERLKKAMEDYCFVKVGTRLTTREVIAQEKTLLNFINTGTGRLEPLKVAYEPSSDLSDDEILVMRHLLRSTDQVTGFRGLAGVGKTHVLGKFREVVKSQTCLFLAPTRKAVQALNGHGIKEAGTLAGFLQSSQLHSKIKGGVIVLDEAGLVGVEDMLKLVEIVRKNEARLILSGDTGQHTSVARGDALRLLEEYSDYRYVSMMRIRRQRDEQYKAAVLNAAEKHPLVAWEHLERKGWITEADNSEELAAAHYMSCRDRKRMALVIAPTWREIDKVTVEVRDQLRKRGLIRGKDQTVKVFDSLKWSEPEMENLLNYREQMRVNNEPLRIFFREKHEPFERNEEVTVVAVHNDHLEVERSDGKRHPLFLSRVKKAIDVGREVTLNLTQGDQILFRRNWNSNKKHGFTNGDFGTIKAITKIGITLVDGRMIPRDYRSFTYGYCATSHAAQGATVDEVIISASTTSLQAVDENLFYVSISRGRDRCHIYTDDRDSLKEAICKSGKRTAGMELEMELQAKASKRINSSRRKSLDPNELLLAPQEYFSVHPMALGMRILMQAIQGRALPVKQLKDGQLPADDLSIDL